MDFMTHEQERHDCRFFKNMMMIIVSKHCIEETVWCMLCLLNSVVHPTIACLTSVQKCARHLEERAHTFHNDLVHNGLSWTNAQDDLGRDGWVCRRWRWQSWWVLPCPAWTLSSWPDEHQFHSETNSFYSYLSIDFRDGAISLWHWEHHCPKMTGWNDLNKGNEKNNIT